MKKIVFVCLGNICRSTMAEFVMKDLVEKAGRSSEFHIESRATSTWEHGNPIHQGTQNIFKLHDIAYDESKTSLQISKEDFEKFDKIIAMDDQNQKDLLEMAAAGTENKIAMLLDYSVPDPWYTGDFEETYQLVSKGASRLLD